MTKLLLIILAIFCFACSKAPEKSSVKISLGYLGEIPAFNGGFALWAQNDQGRKIRLALPAGQTDLDPIELDLGKWNFFAFGWDNGSMYFGPAYCGFTQKEIDQAEAEISLDVSLANCIKPEITSSEFLTSGNLQPISIFSCQDVLTKQPGDNCDSAAKGNWKSYKFILPTSPDLNISLPLMEVSTECIPESSPGSFSETLTLKNLPVLAHAGSPDLILIKAYESSDCNEGSYSEIFDFSSPFQGRINVMDTGSMTAVYLRSPNTYTGASNLSALSNERILNVTAGSIDFAIDISGDDNGNIDTSAIATYCIDTTTAGCIPGTPVPFSRLSNTLSATISGLAEGDKVYFDIASTGFDADGDDTTGITSLVPTHTMAITSQLTPTLNSGSTGTSSTPNITVSSLTGSGSYVEVFYNSSTCTTNSMGNVAPDTSTFNLPSALPGDGSYNLYFREHKNGVYSPCSSPSITYTLDTMAPLISITNPVLNFYINDINKAAFSVGGGCNENGATIDFIFNGQNIGSAACIASNYSATLDVTGISDADSKLFIASITDLAGNTNSAGTTISKETILPTSVISDSTGGTSTAGSWTATITFSEDITGLEIADFGVTNGSISNIVPASASTYNFDVTADGAGTVSVILNAATVEDLAGNPNNASTTRSVTYTPSTNGSTLSNFRFDGATPTYVDVKIDLADDNNSNINLMDIVDFCVDEGTAGCSPTTDLTMTLSSGILSGRINFSTEGAKVYISINNTGFDSDGVDVSAIGSLTQEFVNPITTDLTSMAITQSIGNTLTPQISFASLITDASVEVFYNSSCSTNRLGVGAPNITTLNLPSPLPSVDALYTLYLKQEKNGVFGNCQQIPGNYTLDQTDPTPPALDVENNKLYNTLFNITISAGADTNPGDTRYTTDGSAPDCTTSSVGPIVTILPQSTNGDQILVRTITCDAADNASTEVDRTYTYIAPTIEPRYENAPLWNDYVVDDQTFTASPCPGSGECIHGGRIKKVTIPHATCGEITSLNDSISGFLWLCNNEGPDAVFTGTIAPGKVLQNFLNGTSDGWEPITITLSSSKILNTGNKIVSPSTPVWTNPIEKLSSFAASVILADSGKIYTYDSDFATNGIRIGADKISLIKTGPFTLSHGSSFADNCNIADGSTTSVDGKCMLVNDGHNYLYLDVMLDGNYGQKANELLFLHNTRYSNVNYAKLENALGSGFSLVASEHNLIENVSVNNSFDNTTIYNSSNGNGYAGFISQSNKNIFQNLNFSNSRLGVYIEYSDENVFHTTRATHHFKYGMDIQLSNKNSFYKTTISNITTGNTNHGDAFLLTRCNDNVINNITASNAGSGIGMWDSIGNIIMNFTTTNHAGDGLWIADTNSDGSKSYRNKVLGGTSLNNQGVGIHMAYPNDTLISNIYTAHNDYNIQLDNSGSSISKFTNYLITGPSKTANCWTDASAGLNDGSCTNNEASDASLTTSSDFSDQFKGYVSKTSFGGVSWQFLYQPHTIWGLSGIDLKSVSLQGPCDSGQCSQWDYSLKNDSNGLRAKRDQFTLGSGAIITHLLSDGTTSLEFHINATEMIPSLDGFPNMRRGNMNFLCEDLEDCYSNKNIASYQGHGAKGSPDTGNNLASPNIRMWQHQNDGVAP